MVGEGGAAFDPMRDMFPHPRVARPRVEGRGRNHLRPRYWPRITDQELQQISGDKNCTIVPLFEKVLSATDAGCIGRLVLPKACAEAYFPPISQPEGRPLTIQDARGKEWHFQFKFWPNYNGRMYFMEGVTPCIKSLQLQAGDTVTFSRIDPGGKLVMGFRKATNTVSLSDSQISAIANGSLLSETLFSTANENIGAADLHPSSLYDHHMNSADGDVSWTKADKFGSRPDEGSLHGNTVSSRSGIGSNDPCALQNEQPPIVHQDIGSYEAHTVQTPKKKCAIMKCTPKSASVEIGSPASNTRSKSVPVEIGSPASNTRSKKKL